MNYNRLKYEILNNIMLNDLKMEKRWKRPLRNPTDIKRLTKIKSEITDTLNTKHLTYIPMDNHDYFDIEAIIAGYPSYAYAKSNRLNYIETVGEDVIKENLFKIITEGTNYRTITEDQTKSKLAIANYALKNIIQNIPDIKDNQIRSFYISVSMHLLTEAEGSGPYSICLWLLGLTKKGINNIVGGTTRGLYEYTINYYKTVEIQYSKFKIEENTNFYEYLLYSAINSQALTIRGSMKSMSGKLFEHLILGLSLSSMDIQYIENEQVPQDPNNIYFWLSSVEKNSGREKDATISYGDKIIDIDIGLIGLGNPEIISDKLTRFRSKISGGTKNIALEHTIVLAGELNNGNAILQAAKESNTDVIQIINNRYWLRELNTAINKFFENEIAIHPTIKKLKDTIQTTDIQKFI